MMMLIYSSASGANRQIDSGSRKQGFNLSNGCPTGACQCDVLKYRDVNQAQLGEFVALTFEKSTGLYKSITSNQVIDVIDIFTHGKTHLKHTIY